MTVSANLIEAKAVSKPKRLDRLLCVLELEIAVAVILRLPIDQWIMDERGISYAETMSGMIKFFIFIAMFIVIIGFQIKGGRSFSYRRNPGSASGMGMGRWR